MNYLVLNINEDTTTRIRLTGSVEDILLLEEEAYMGDTLSILRMGKLQLLLDHETLEHLKQLFSSRIEKDFQELYIKHDGLRLGDAF